jgi:hypothetical protein
MAPPRLELRGVSKTYANGGQPVPVLHGISLAAEAGTVTALLGRLRQDDPPEPRGRDGFSDVR